MVKDKWVEAVRGDAERFARGVDTNNKKLPRGATPAQTLAKAFIIEKKKEKPT